MEVERPLRQVAHIRRPGRTGRALAVIGLTAAGLAALIGPWLLPAMGPTPPAFEERPVQGDLRAAPVKALTAIEIETPAAPRTAATISAAPASPVSEEEAATLAPPRAALADTAPDGAPAIAADGTVAPSPAPPITAASAPAEVHPSGLLTEPAPAEAPPVPAVASREAPPAEASLVTGSLAVSPVPPQSALATDAARETKRARRALPLPRAFKPSAEREMPSAPLLRRAALSEPARSSALPRPAPTTSRGPLRGPASARPAPLAQAPVGKPSPVVLPNSLLPLGPN